MGKGAVPLSNLLHWKQSNVLRLQFWSFFQAQRWHSPACFLLLSSVASIPFIWFFQFCRGFCLCFVIPRNDSLRSFRLICSCLLATVFLSTSDWRSNSSQLPSMRLCKWSSEVLDCSDSYWLKSRLIGSSRLDVNFPSWNTQSGWIISGIEQVSLGAW